MPKRFLANIMTDAPTAPAGSFANSAASGVWSLAEALAYQKAGQWPIPGNFPPFDVRLLIVAGGGECLRDCPVYGFEVGNR